MKRNTSLILGPALATAAVLIATVIAAADGGDRSLIHACVNKIDGAVRIVKYNESCRNNERTLHWNIQHTVLTPLGSDTVDLSQFPGTMRRIRFKEGANLQLDTTDITGGSSARYWFTFPDSDGAFTIQDAMLIIEGPGVEGQKKLFFDWEGGEEGQYAGLVYDTSSGTLYFHLSPQPDRRPVPALALTGSVLDASAVDIRPKFYADVTEPDIPEDTFAFWRPGGDTVYLLADVDNAQYRTAMAPGGPGTLPSQATP